MQKHQVCASVCMQFSGMDGKEREGGRGSIESWRVKAELPQTFINVNNFWKMQKASMFV